jgi:hypothetical protein
MPSLLEIQIGLHYWHGSGQYPDIKSKPVQHAIDNLLRNGLIEEQGNGYRKSDALSHWVKALMNVPFPVIE